jgi:hypothetical protein
MKLSQVRLLVDDFPGCFRFLRDALGLECTSGGEDVRDPDGNMFELFQTIPMEG